MNNLPRCGNRAVPIRQQRQCHPEDRNLTYDGTNTLTYDVENRLVQAQNLAWGTSQYFYDPLGNRKQKQVGASVTQFVVAGGEEIADLSSAGWTLTVRGVGGLPVAAITPASGGSAEYVVYYHHDVAGSTTIATSSGSSPEVYTYGEFGVAGAGGYLHYTYAGYRYDSETGLYYVHARYYNPTLGRFLQTDPIGIRGGNNLYAYVNNDPINLFDPTGHNWFTNLVSNVAIATGKTLVNMVNFFGGDSGHPTSLPPLYGPSNTTQAVTMGAFAVASIAAPVFDAAFGGSATVSAATSAPVELESTPQLTTLFRAVDSTEMEDLQSTGAWNTASPNGADGKGFFYSQDSAAQFGAQQSVMGGPSTSVVTSTAPTDMVNASYQQSAATEGQAVFIQNENLPQVTPQVPPK